jgi:hypothetical protein
MSQTTHQKKQIQKKLARRKEIVRKGNIERNLPSERFRLDLEIEGKWRLGVRYWRYMQDVEYHKTNTENLRSQGEEIVGGRIVDTVRREVIAKIPASKAKGAAPDKIEDGVKAAAPIIRTEPFDEILIQGDGK